MLEDPLQHFSRAAGFGAYLVLWADMCLGVALSGQVNLPFTARWRVGDLHQFTGFLGLGLLGAHIAVLIGLQQNAFTLPEMFVPFLRPINPAAPVLGITGMYVLLTVALVSRARRFVGIRLWRAVHTLSFVAFVLALVHAIVAGPDGSAFWVRAMYAATVVVLVGLTALRVRRRFARNARRVGYLTVKPAA